MNLLDEIAKEEWVAWSAMACSKKMYLFMKERRSELLDKIISLTDQNDLCKEYFRYKGEIDDIDSIIAILDELKETKHDD